MKRSILFSFIIFLISLQAVFTADCNTPIECYLKAYEQVQLIKAEFRGRIINLEQYQFKSTNDIKSLDEKLQTSEKNNQLLEKRISDVEARFTASISSLTEKIESLVSENVSLKEKLSNITNEINQIKENSKLKNYIYKDEIVYQNVFDGLEKGVISKHGNPNGWDDTTYRVNEWDNRHILRIGIDAQNNGNGLLLKVPEGRNTLWLRVLNSDLIVLRIASVANPDGQIEKYACGKRGINEMSPDGSTSDTHAYNHQWCPIPLREKGDHILYSDRNHGWISGVAFSKNIWNHAKNSALAYHWAINGGVNVEWESENWNNDILARIPAWKISQLIVPVLPNGKDKLLYLIEHNNNWNGAMHTSIMVNGVNVERFRQTFMNPFETHYNSKLYMRYIATRIPKEIIDPNSKFLSVQIDMTKSKDNIYFREVGTHDYFE